MFWKRHLLLIVHRAFRSIRMQYGGSLGAVVWMFLNPLVMFCIYYFAVTVIFRLKMDRPYGFGEFLFCGLWVWTSFSNAIMKSTTVLVNEGPILKKVFFPPTVLVPSVVLESFIGLGAGLLLFILYRFFAATGDGGSALSLVFLFPLLFFLALFTTGLGWICSVLNVYWRDLTHFMGIALTVWFYATPVIYPPELVPEKWKGLLLLNPAYPFIELFRKVLLEHHPGPLLFWLIVMSFSLTFFFFGIRFTRLFYPKLVDFL